MGRPLFFQELYQTLLSATPTSGRDFDQHLYYQLEQAKPRFLQLFDIPPRDPKEEQAIRTGTAKLHGTTAISHFNETFKAETLFLAQELNCSEILCAELIDGVAVMDSLGRSATAEKAVMRLHEDRSYMLQSLRRIYEGAMNPASLSPRVATMLSKYSLELMTGTFDFGAGRGKGRIAEKIILELDRLKQTIEKTRVSLNNAPSTTNNASFGNMILKYRLGALQQERAQFGHILFLLSSTREMDRTGVTKLVRWLAAAERSDPLIFYVLTSVLSSLDVVEEQDEMDGASGLIMDHELMVQMNSALEQTSWKVAELKACVNLQWSLWVREVRSRDPHLQGNLRGIEEDVEKIALSGIKGNAFQYLRELVLASSPGADDTMSSAAEESGNTIGPDFQSYFLDQLDTLVQSLIVVMNPILKKLRTKEDDAEYAGSRVMRLSVSAAQEPSRRNDTEALFRLIAAIYDRREPDSGLKFWREDGMDEGRLLAFLCWATEVKRPALVVAVYDMLASLARGPTCAEEAFNFFTNDSRQGQSQSNFSWVTLFIALHQDSELLLKSVNPQARSGNGQMPAGSTLPSEEVFMLRAFLRLLRNVIRYSKPAREVIRYQQNFNALQTLFNLVIFPVPLELKAALYETLAAFCTMDGAAKGVETIRTIWHHLERSGILRQSVSSTVEGGVAEEMERSETPQKQYPGTTSFIELLVALVPVAKGSTTEELSDVDTHAIPENLGAPHRSPGLGPYLTFVIDTVLIKHTSREYRSATERFRLLDGAFHFVENCLESYELPGLPSIDLSPASLKNTATISTIAALCTHPGFGVLSRILTTESQFRQTLFDYVRAAFDAIERDEIRTPYFNSAVRRVLRILYRVLRIQTSFIDILLPLLAQNPDIQALARISLPRGILQLEQYLIWSPELVPQIGMYVNRIEDQEMMLLAVHILSLISDSPIFNVIDSHLPNVSRRMNRLVVLLDRHELTPTIIQGFVRLLEVDPEETNLGQDSLLALDDLPNDTARPRDLRHALRESVMRLLLQNTATGRPAPNLAHLILGYPVRVPPSEMSITDPSASSTGSSCLHAVLTLLNAGVPKLRTTEIVYDDGSFKENGILPLFHRNPTLAEQCYRLIYQLCFHDYTSAPTLRYLRTREDFFARHLAILPIRPMASPSPKDVGVLAYTDRSQLPTSCTTLTSFLRLRSCILECVALELHQLSQNKQAHRLGQLLELLFDVGAGFSPYGDSGNNAFGGVGVAQPLIRLLEIFDSLDFKWEDTIKPKSINLQVYREADFAACQETDENDCQVYSVPLVMGVVSTKRRQIQRQNGATPEALLNQIKAETSFVLDSCVRENHERQIERARAKSFEAWTRVLDVTLHESFDRLPLERRELITLDILQALATFLSRTSVSLAIAQLLAESILTLTTVLRADRHHQEVVQSTVDDAFAASLPVDRVHSAFRSIVQCVAQNGTSEAVRGNLYSSLTNFIHLVTAEDNTETQLGSTSDNLKLSRTFSLIADDHHSDLSFLGSSTVRRAPIVTRAALESGTLAIINMFAERFVPVICKDAVDGSDLWKTVTFTYLDALIQLSRTEKAHQVLAVMAREGYLKNFMQSIKTADSQIMGVLKPDPDNLDPLYVYEAKMSLLIRIAQTRQGAERLLDCRVFAVLSQCEFIDARPQNDHAFIDQDSFLPSAISRYHQMLAPALELTVSILSAVGQTPIVLKQALAFVLAHRSTVLVLLTDRWDQLTLAQLRELQLLVALCSLVLPVVDDLFVPTGFGAIHTAILSLSAICTSPRRWQEDVVPADENESQQAETVAKGYGRAQGESVWSQNVDTAASALRKWLAIYSTNVTESKGDFKPVIAPVRTSAVEGESAARIRSPAPSITDVIATLGNVQKRLASVIQQVQEMRIKLQSPAHIAVDDVDQVIQASYADFLDELDVSQRRTLAKQELKKACMRQWQNALDTLHWFETLLLLIWRHLDFFFVKSPRLTQHMAGAPDNTALDTSRSMRILKTSTSQWGSNSRDLRQHCAETLLPILHDAEDMDMSREAVGVDCGSRKAYIDLLTRRLREVLSQDALDERMY
ncbi:hypothetical protein FRB93_000744 [Tulasnella sp. JGI-2019a]|nr:hypothetical protein FRB93_000744 [Tulasnella sp. JGI-2019a]